VNRRAIAIVACTLWLFGVEALPNLHLGTHRDDHTHAVDGAIVPTHRHADGTVHALGGRTQPPKRRSIPQLAFDEISHDATGIAHRTIAWTAPPPPIVAPLPYDAPFLSIVTWRSQRPSTLTIFQPSSRGPPT
jgi:hypothetical protein